MTLTEMLSKCRKGDEEAWNTFISTFYYFVYYLADKFMTPMLADEETIGEVVADVFSILSRNKMAILDEYEPGIPFTAFLRRVVVQRIIKYCDRNGIERLFEHDIDMEEAEKKISDSAPEEKMALSLYSDFNLSISEAAHLAGITGKRLSELAGIQTEEKKSKEGALELIEDDDEEPKPSIVGKEDEEGDSKKITRRRRGRSSRRRRRR